MKSLAIIYKSVHHNNTKILVEGIRALVDADIFEAGKAKEIDFSEYSIIGFASGVYLSKMHRSLTDIAKNNQSLPRRAFIMCTSGIGKGYGRDLERILLDRGINVIGIFNCKGYDTFGFFKLLGGISRNHPDNIDIQNAVEFISKLLYK